MTVEMMRHYISDLYTGVGWKERVALMPDGQVKAIYFSCLKYDRFNKKPAKKTGYTQLNLFDMGLREYAGNSKGEEVTGCTGTYQNV